MQWVSYSRSLPALLVMLAVVFKVRAVNHMSGNLPQFIRLRMGAVLDDRSIIADGQHSEVECYMVIRAEAEHVPYLIWAIVGAPERRDMGSFRVGSGGSFDT
ncbi:hypothetical protein ADK70_30385 [Streptomyces rimosus subsp. pseudoverticillatus]|nr:hypothetical protein ADK70_30385 [Streptomyces rimosus subsp. pseudoverticillatus]